VPLVRLVREPGSTANLFPWPVSTAKRRPIFPAFFPTPALCLTAPTVPSLAAVTGEESIILPRPPPALRAPPCTSPPGRGRQLTGAALRESESATETTGSPTTRNESRTCCLAQDYRSITRTCRCESRLAHATPRSRRRLSFGHARSQCGVIMAPPARKYSIPDKYG